MTRPTERMTRPSARRTRPKDDEAISEEDKADLQYLVGSARGRCSEGADVFINHAGFYPRLPPEYAVLVPVYMTAALGVILDHNSNTQKFFGGGEVANTAKNVANDENHHTDDIMCLKVDPSRGTAASGQVGSKPTIFTWDACSG